MYDYSFVLSLQVLILFQADQTPEALNIEDGDSIDAMIEQTGGMKM
jgi:hypothetical protein